MGIDEEIKKRRAPRMGKRANSFDPGPEGIAPRRQSGVNPRLDVRKRGKELSASVSARYPLSNLNGSPGQMGRQRPGVPQMKPTQTTQPSGGLGRLIPPDGTNQLQMLEQQTAGFGTASDVVGHQNRAMQPDMTHPQLPEGVLPGNGGGFVNTLPPKGYGSAIYSDTPQGAAGIGGSNVVQALDQNGNPSYGPFGRSEQEQKAITDRVGMYQRAIELMQSMRGGKSEKDKLTGRAQQRISLNQGIGGFANQAADRNYAREQLAALNQGEIAAADRNAEAQQNAIKNAFEAEKVNQGRFKTQAITTGYDPLSGKEIQGLALIDTRTGEVKNAGLADNANQLAPQITKDQAILQATKEADDANSGLSGFFTSDEDVYKNSKGDGISKDQWIKERVAELMSGTQQSGAATQQQATGTATATGPNGEKMVFDTNTMKWVKA